MDDGRRWVANTIPRCRSLIRSCSSIQFKHPFDGLPNRATVATWLANPGGIEPLMAVGVMKSTGMASAAM